MQLQPSSISCRNLSFLASNEFIAHWRIADATFGRKPAKGEEVEEQVAKVVIFHLEEGDVAADQPAHEQFLEPVQATREDDGLHVFVVRDRGLARL